MLRSFGMRSWLVVGCWLPLTAAASAAIWPDQIGDYKKVASKAVAVESRALWDEYGLSQAEQAEYAGGGRHFTGTAYRLKDSTSAFGAFEWQRPSDARPLKLADMAAETGDNVLFLFGNYVFRCDGGKPQASDLDAFLGHLPGLDRTQLPNSHLPATGIKPNSKRYVLGPAGLDRFQPGVPPAVAAFSMGAEVEIAQYDTPAGPMQLAVFSYPTPQIARQRLAEFQSLPGALAKRAGPLVAFILSPKDPNQAERLLALVSYKAEITLSERVPTARDNIGELFLNIFILVGYILAVFITAGVGVAVARRLGWGTSGDPMTLLHLEDRSPKSTQS
jgi:hypothetical protein